LYGAETWTVRKVDQKKLESFEMWYWRIMEKISCTHRAKNEVLNRVTEKRNILHAIKRRKLNYTGYILQRYYLLNTLLKER